MDKMLKENPLVWIRLKLKQMALSDIYGDLNCYLNNPKCSHCRDNFNTALRKQYKIFGLNTVLFKFELIKALRLYKVYLWACVKYDHLPNKVGSMSKTLLKYLKAQDLTHSNILGYYLKEKK